MGSNGEGGIDQPISHLLGPTNVHHQMTMGNAFGQQNANQQQQLVHQQFQHQRQLALALAGLGQQQVEKNYYWIN
jgi:hypothetical protein